MKSKKTLLSLALLCVMLLFVGFSTVNATEYEESLIKRIAPDGENAVFKAEKPADAAFSEYYITNIVNHMLDDREGYSAWAYCNLDENGEPDLTNCTIEFYNADYDFVAEYNIHVTWEEPEENAKVAAFINSIPQSSNDNLEDYYQVTDLGLINYYLSGDSSELWNAGAASRAIKFSDEVIELTDGGNYAFQLEVGMGRQGDEYMYESAYGEVAVFFNGYAYESKSQGVHLKRVLYIPEDTEDTPEAYIAAAQKRINDYLGKNDVAIISYGGLLSSLAEEWYKDPTVSESETDGNYYNVTIGERTYYFYIMKGTDEQMVAPTYMGSDVNTNITITTTESSVPLDTSITVEAIVSDEIKDILGTDEYTAYDIKLYSDGKGASITELENGMFLVSIPVSTSLSGKTITVYYLNSQNELEVHDEIIVNDEGIACFETNHFSTYVLTETIQKVTSPDTGLAEIDIYLYLTFAVSAIGLAVLKKRMK